VGCRDDKLCPMMSTASHGPDGPEIPFDHVRRGETSILMTIKMGHTHAHGRAGSSDSD
jgi:hypothetical protein